MGDEMAARFIQLRDVAGERLLAMSSYDGLARPVSNAATLRDLALLAITAGLTLAQAAEVEANGVIDIEAALAEGRVLSPIDHPDNAHLLLSGTGLTHLGSAAQRDAMHKAAQSGEGVTDSMRMFLMGVEGGAPGPGEVGVQPEWFYKGDGSSLVAPGAPLRSPAFAQDGGDEAEIAGVYIIAPDGQPCRLGFCLANEFSDHLIERGNYLWLAHSKLRQAALGPELLTGELPRAVDGVSRILRQGQVVWEADFLSGEERMSHSIANLEHHHFKYRLFRRPGDIHVHFFGAAALSFADGFRAESGDVFEMSATPFRYPVRNPLALAPDETVAVRPL